MDVTKSLIRKAHLRNLKLKGKRTEMKVTEKCIIMGEKK